MATNRDLTKNTRAAARIYMFINTDKLYVIPVDNNRDIASCTISEAAIRQVAFKHYGLDVQRSRLLGVSENRGYEIDVSNGRKFFARIHVNEDRYAARIPSEYDLLDRLARELPDAAPSGIRTKNGDCFVQIESDGQPCLFMLFSWLPGKHISADQLSVERAAAMAETTARFHLASQKMTYDFIRPVYNFEFYCGNDSFYYRKDLRDHISEKDMAPFLGVKDLFQAYAASHEHDGKGMIHYDLHLGNFLFDEGRARIIDFDECGYGFYLFDLGHILFAQHTHKNYPEIEAAFIERYEAVSGTTLPMDDLRMFKGVQAVAIIHYFFRLYDRSQGKQNYFHVVPDISNSLREITEGLFA